MRCKSGKHELAMLIDDCAYCKIEKLEKQTRELAGAMVCVRAMRRISDGFAGNKDIPFTVGQINEIVRDALEIYSRTLPAPENILPIAHHPV